MRPIGFNNRNYPLAEKKILEALRVSARNDTTITYEGLQEAVGTRMFHHRSSRSYDLLDDLCQKHYKDAGCLITSLVVKAGDFGISGKRFFKLAHELGFRVNHRGIFWRQQQAQASKYLKSL